MTLRIAIVHYHLRPGGVTRVIEHAIDSLTPLGHQVAVVCGEPPENPPHRSARVAVLPALGYGTSHTPQTTHDSVTTELRAAATQALGTAPDLWHVHNHALGKNATLPTAVSRLAADGEALLLQLHDFAEDSRPANWAYLSSALSTSGVTLYPQSLRIALAVLNGRDERALLRAGVSPEALETLPNPVSGDRKSSSVELHDPPLFLYPTRAIRRKNLGEFLLWSQLAGDGAQFATTLSPRNPHERSRYERWKKFATEHQLPVQFAVGEDTRMSFEDRMRSATALVTTSVTEGFGMSFLEPWLFGREVLGRDLPEITADFKAAGVDLSALYSRLDVPVAWVGREELRERLRRAIEANYKAYGRPLPADGLERAFQAAVTEDEEGVDFGRLDESLQETVLRRLWKDPGARQEPRPRQLDERAVKSHHIEKNRRRVAREFALPAYGRRLESIYRRLLEAPAEIRAPLSPEKVLDAFLHPESFFLLRS